MASPVDSHVGARIRARREAMHERQTDLAARMAITPQALAKWEVGLAKVAPERLYYLAKAQGVPVGFYFEGFDNG